MSLLIATTNHHSPPHLTVPHSSTSLNRYQPQSTTQRNTTLNTLSLTQQTTFHSISHVFFSRRGRNLPHKEPSAPHHTRGITAIARNIIDSRLAFSPRSTMLHPGNFRFLRSQGASHEIQAFADCIVGFAVYVLVRNLRLGYMLISHPSVTRNDYFAEFSR
jgi:hypothetical protein